jgi:uncharacterized protein
MKYLLMLLTVLAVVWLLRGARRGTLSAEDPKEQPPAAPGRAVQNLTRCAHCGLHLTLADSKLRDGQPYCGVAHWLAGPRAPYGRR